MCFSAIHWAKMKTMYYACTRQDAADIGFDDKFIYDVIKGIAKKKQLTLVQIDRLEGLKPFEEWKQKEDRVNY